MDNKLWDVWFMKHVYLAASKSKDPRTKIGAVLVKDKRIISNGYNGFPYNVNDLEQRYLDRPTKYKFICHGEFNAVLQCARFGTSSKDSILYTQGIPCDNCCKVIIQGGIKEIICHRQWPDMVNSDAWKESIAFSQVMLAESGISIKWLDEVLGLKGFLDGKEIDV
jgi:dCMP deaminase